MATWFDEARLDDAGVLETVDLRLRTLAESGARVRREAQESAAATTEAIARGRDEARPRAVIAAGPDSRLLRAVLEAWCPVPFVAWPHPGLPGWAGSLDLVVMLAPEGNDHGSASAVAEAVRRGAQVVVACPERSLVGEHAAGRHVTVLPTVTGDQLATAVVVLDYLAHVHLGPRADAESVADVPRPRRRRTARRTATSRSIPPRCWRSRWPTRTRSSGAAPSSRPALPVGWPSRCAAPAAAPRSPVMPSTCSPSSWPPGRTTCSPTRSPTSPATCGRCC